MTSKHHGEAGFTLVEVIVSVGLFGLISLAGFVLVDSILSVQSRTDGRLERLGNMQRAMVLITSDFEQVAAARLDHTGDAVIIERAADGAPGGTLTVRYGLAEGALVRDLTGGYGARRGQVLLRDVDALDWSFYTDITGWTAQWPPEGGMPGPQPRALPRMIALTITFSDETEPGGTLRRVVDLPMADAS